MKRGFTLIELLIVIAIIGVLSAIVITSLNTSRNKAKVISIKSGMSSLLKEIYIQNNGSLPIDNSSGNWGGAPCPTSSNPNGNGTFFDLNFPKFIEIFDSIRSNSGVNLQCYDNRSSSGKWVIVAYYPAGDNAWCIDSSGINEEMLVVSVDTTNDQCF